MLRNPKLLGSFKYVKLRNSRRTKKEDHILSFSVAKANDKFLFLFLD